MLTQDPIVIIGGGFAGVFTVRELLRQGVPVTLVSDENCFTFTPLLHEVAPGSLLPNDIVFEYESFFHSNLFRFIRGRVKELEREKKVVRLEGGHSLSYSFLVIATGSLTNLSMVNGGERAFVLKDVADAVRLKNAILDRAQGFQRHVAVCVVGGGPTGLELVFDIDRMLRSLQRKAPGSHYELRIIHAAETFCSTSADSVQRYIRRALVNARIETVCGASAQEITPSEVKTNRGSFHSDVTVLCAGVVPNTKMFAQSLPLDEKGHIQVNARLQTLADPHIFALGDVIAIAGKPVSKLAQTAVREASIVAENIARLARGQEDLVAYREKVVVTLFSLGFGDGVGTIGGVIVKGWLAWYIWRTVYLFKIPGLWNKLRVAFTWTIGLFQGRNLTAL